MKSVLAREFDWSSIIDSELFDQKRTRVGRVVAVVAEGEESERCAKVDLGPLESRSLLVPINRIGIIGNGWVMLDDPVSALGDLLTGEQPAESAEPNGSEDTEPVQAATPIASIHGPCPLCGSVTHD